MPSFLIFIIVLPLVGAVVTLGLSLVSRLRSYAHYIALGVAVPTAVLVLMLRWMGPAIYIPSLWQPSLLFAATPMLRNDAAMQPLVFTLALAACATILMSLARRGVQRPQTLAVLLVLLPASFVALWAANPLTMVVGWAIYDLVLTAAYVTVNGWGRGAMRGLIFGGLATLLLWGGTLLSAGKGESSLWVLMTPTEAQLALWVAAGVLRLWVYPFHLAVPDALGDSSAFTTFLLSPVLGWGLCLRLVMVNGGSFPDGAWVPPLAALTLGLGGFFAWSCKSIRTILPWVSLGVTGATLLAVSLIGMNAAVVIIAGCVVWALGMTVLFLTEGLQQKAPWWSIPALIGALALLGLPLTLGFVFQAPLLGGIAHAGRLWWGAAFFFGNLFLVASLIRWLLASAPTPLPGRYWQLAVYGTSLGIPALLLLMSGFYPPLLVVGIAAPAMGEFFSMPGLAGWLVWVVSLSVGGVLAWQDENVRQRIALLLDALHDLLRLEWLYDTLVGALERGLSAIRAVDEIVGGAGALLWSMLIFLLLLLIWSSQ
jgi:formate hydrogenlyase subunit 3/multisubunit Na+/H+ antiporter MnhD subunit